MNKLKNSMFLVLLTLLFLFFAKPVYQWFKKINIEILGFLKDIIIFLQMNPIVTLVIIALILFHFFAKRK